MFFGNGGPHAEEIQVFTSLLSCNEWKAVEKGTESTKTILPGPGSQRRLWEGGSLVGTAIPPGPSPLRGPGSTGNEDEEPIEIVAN